MKKIVIFLLIYPIFLFSGIFEHFLDKNKTYIQNNHFTCDNKICQTKEKNIYDNAIIDDSIKIVRVYLDQNDVVFKIEIELLFHDERKNGFFQAIVDSSSKNKNIEYKLRSISDKYGNHTKITIISKHREQMYISYFRNKYYNVMKQYKENSQK